MILVDGRPAETVTAADRGLQYGDGLFETLAVRRGRPELWDRHLRRLAGGCARLGLPAPDPATLAGEAAGLCRGVDRGVLKLLLTRGAGGRGYRPPPAPRPTRILSLHPWPDYPPAWWREGVVARVCRQPLSLNPALAGLKHLNRLDQVLARAEWDNPAVAEGLMLDPLGRVVEGTMSNLFLGRRGVLYTPRLDQAGVAGVMRALVLELAARQGLSCREVNVSLADLEAADEVFLCNSVVGLWPVRRLEGKVYPAPGPLAARLTPILEEARVP